MLAGNKLLSRRERGVYAQPIDATLCKPLSRWFFYVVDVELGHWTMDMGFWHFANTIVHSTIFPALHSPQWRTSGRQDVKHRKREAAQNGLAAK